MGSVSNPQVSDRDLPNIILLVLDSVRGDRITRQEEFNLSTPTLNELAEEGISFKNAHSTGSWTIPAHGSLFTGKLPREHGAHAKHKYFDAEPETTLAGKLSSKGYNTVGFSTNPWISDEFGFATGFDEFYELRSSLPFSGVETDPRDELDDPTIQEAVQWVISGSPIKRVVNGIYAKYFQKLPYAPAGKMNKEILSRLSSSSKEPFFLFANYMDAHEPYIIRNEYIEGESEMTDNILDFGWNLNSYNNSPNEKHYDQIRDIYDSSISYLDHSLRELVTEIDLENTLLLVAGDHGQALGENDYWGHGTHLSESSVHVPLIVHPPANSNSLRYDSSNIISLRELPFLIFSFLGLGQEYQYDKSLIETNISIAESFGPHQRVDNLPSYVSNVGYRMVFGESMSMLHNLEDSKREFFLRGSSNNHNHEKQQNSLIMYENEIIKNTPKKNFNKKENIAEGTKKRLDDLGYL